MSLHALSRGNAQRALVAQALLADPENAFGFACRQLLFPGALGLLVALWLTALQNLANNAWLNTFVASLFLAFGLSLLGAFEITIPSVILTRLNKSADQGGGQGDRGVHLVQGVGTGKMDDIDRRLSHLSDGYRAVHAFGFRDLTRRTAIAVFRQHSSTGFRTRSGCSARVRRWRC